MIKIVPYQKKYFSQVCALIVDVFLKHVAKDFTKEGIKNYTDFFLGKKDPQKLAIRFNTMSFIALDKDKVIGVVKGRPAYCNVLFVDSRYHGQGIGKKLLTKFEDLNKEQGETYIKLKASSYAVPFYQAVGYKKTTGLRSYHGEATVQPMKKVLI